MLNTAPFYSLSGNVTMDIDLGGSSVSTEMTSMGDITFEFDLIPTESVSQTIGGIPGACTVQIRNTMSNRGSFYDAMSDAIGEYNVVSTASVPQSNVNIKLVDRSNPQNTYYFPFSLKFQDIELDERSDIATLKLSPKTTNININTWVSDRLPIVNQFPSIILPYNYEALSRFETNNNTVPAGDFIYDVVSLLGQTSATQNIYETGQNVARIPVVNGAKYGTLTNVNCDAFPRQQRMASLGNGSVIPSFIFKGTNDGSFVYDRDRSAIEFVQMFAGMEGAIFGSAFSVNYYVNRTSTNRNVEITKSDLIDLKFVSVPRSYNSIVYNYETQTTRNGTILIPDGEVYSNTNIFFRAWPDATQQAKLGFTSYNPFLIFGAFEADAVSEYGYTYISNSGPITSNRSILNIYQDGLSTKSFTAFAAPLGAGSSYKTSLKIDFDIRGVTKVKPWEVIRFDFTVPSRYQGKFFRPTSLQYDFKSDRIRGTAYEVGTFVPVTTLPPPTTTGSPTTTLGPTTTSTSTTSTTTTAATTTTTTAGGTTTTTTAGGTTTTTTAGGTTTTSSTTQTPSTEYTILHNGSQNGIPTPWTTEANACSGRFSAFSTSSYGIGGITTGQKLFRETTRVNPLADGFYVYDIYVIEIAGGQGVIASIDLISSVCPTTTTTSTSTTTTSTTTTLAPIYIGNTQQDACDQLQQISLTFDSGQTFCSTTNYFGDFSAYIIDQEVYISQSGQYRKIKIATASGSGSAVQLTSCTSCSGTTTTTTSGTTTTTNAGTTTTSTSTTTTTTTIATDIYTDISSGATSSDACNNHPGINTLYGNNITFQSSTRFFTDAGGTVPFNGSSQYYSDGFAYVQIDANGNVIDTGLC